MNILGSKNLVPKRFRVKKFFLSKTISIPEQLWVKKIDLLDTFITPFRHLPDTLQTPFKHTPDTFQIPIRRLPDILQIKDLILVLALVTWGKRNQLLLRSIKVELNLQIKSGVWQKLSAGSSFPGNGERLAQICAKLVLES